MPESNYDKVRLFFEDGTETIIYVHTDDDIGEKAAEVADELGIEVVNYRIKGTA